MLRCYHGNYVHTFKDDYPFHFYLSVYIEDQLWVNWQDVYQGRSLALIYTEARGLGLYTIFHQKYELVTQILVLNNSDQTVKYEEQYSIM